MPGRHKLLSATTAEPVLDIALVIPQHGSAGIFGPSCELCGQLAAEEVNAAGGILGREVRLTVVDGSRPPAQVTDEVGALVAAALARAGQDTAAAAPWGHGVIGLVRAAADWWLRADRPMPRAQLAVHLTDLAWAGLSGVVTPVPRTTTEET